MKITFVHPDTRQHKSIKTGFSWINFFFSQFLGIPLFFQGLIAGGIYSLIVYLFYAKTYYELFIETNHSFTSDWEAVQSFYIVCGLMILNGIAFGVWANRLRAHKLLDKGYHIKDADNDFIKSKLRKWGIEGDRIKPYISDSSQPINKDNSLEKLEKLNELKKSGALTEEEFIVEKKKVLNQP